MSTAASIPAERTATSLLAGQSKRGRLIKRAGDIGFSLLVLALGSPLLLLLAVLVKLSSKGSVFYCQRRIGRGYRGFGCLKFRTMRKDADRVLAQVLASDPELRAEFERDFKLKNDPRITPIGKFLGGLSHSLRRIAALTLDGVRRELHIDLDSVAHLRPEITAAVAEVAALPVDKRQIAMAGNGLLAPHWPKPFGREALPAEQLLIDQELAAAGVDRPDLVIGWWAVPTILEHGTAEQIDHFVPATLRGELIWCQLFSEPGAGSDLAALRTKAVRTEGCWKLNGQKVWTSAAHRADWGVCLARTDADAPKHKGITYFLVDMRSPGIEIRPLREITGHRNFNEVFFDDLFVPDEMVVGEINGGWPLARNTLANERVAMAHGTALGNPMEEMLRNFSQRQLDPAMTDRLGDLLLAAQVGSLLDHRIAQLAVTGQDTSAEASARKLIGVRYRQSLEEFRMELAPGAGVVINDAVQMFLNTRCLSIAGGTEQILLTMAGERLLGLPR